MTEHRDLLRATAETQGWNGYRNKSQHRKLTLEKKILPHYISITGPLGHPQETYPVLDITKLSNAVREEWSGIPELPTDSGACGVVASRRPPGGDGDDTVLRMETSQCEGDTPAITECVIRL